MANFNEDGLKKKLDDLNMSQQSIQTLSLWLIHHKKHAHTVVNVWFRELIAASDSRKLTFMYLANDVIQNSKKKGPEYNKEFGGKLGRVFEHLGQLRLDEKSVRGLTRLLTVWDERNVFEQDLITVLKKNLNKTQHKSKENRKRDNSGDPPDKPHKKKKKSKKKSSRDVSPLRVVEEEVAAAPDTETDTAPTTTTTTTTTLIEPSAATPPATPPEPEQLIEALQELESAATSDAIIRKKIASLPDEVSDVNLLSKLEDLGAARTLSKTVEEALAMLEAYNKRLTEEMEARKGVAKLLHDYITHQKDLLAQAEETLEEHRQKQQKVKKVREELRAHLQNLPDISKLPNIRTGGLAPLPSAENLFT